MKTRYFTIKKKNNELKIKKINKKLSLLAVRGNVGSMAITLGEYVDVKKINNAYFFKGKKNNFKKLLKTSMEKTNKITKRTISLVGRNLKITESENVENNLILDAGYSNKVKYTFKGNENFIVEQKNTCSFFSLDKNKIKKITNQLRSLRPPNPYTGKGIFIDNEKIKRKQGKKTQY